MNIHEISTMKMKAQNELMQAMTADELQKLASELYDETERLQRSGVKNRNEDELRLAIKYKNAASWATQVMAQKRYA